jgi:hypothetical protein
MQISLPFLNLPATQSIAPSKTVEIRKTHGTEVDGTKEKTVRTKEEIQRLVLTNQHINTLPHGKISPPSNFPSLIRMFTQFLVLFLSIFRQMSQKI